MKENSFKNIWNEISSTQTFVSVIIAIISFQYGQDGLDGIAEMYFDKPKLETRIINLQNTLSTIEMQLAQSKAITLEPFANNTELKTKYTEAKKKFSEGDYDNSIKILKSIRADININEHDVAYVLYWLGENETAKDTPENYKNALDFFLKILDKHRYDLYLSSQKKLATIYMVAKCYDKLEDFENARFYYKQLVEESKYNYCQPIFEIAEKRLEKIGK